MEGTSRGVWYGTRSTNPTEGSASSGAIDGVYCKEIGPWKDADGLAIQAFDGLGGYVTAPVSINNVRTKNSEKRSVKVQANGVTVSNIVGRSDKLSEYLGNPRGMYEIVSIYGDMSNRCSNVRGYGRVNSGVDTQGYCKVEDVAVNSTFTYESGAALAVTQGSCDGFNIQSVGLQHIISVRSNNGPVESVTVNGITGLSTERCVRIQATGGNNIDLVAIDGNSEITPSTSTDYAI
ncbi:hypothetical protein AB9H28_23410, partial [Salmonella enterica subsp. enterica serovar Kentucky]|uniref:hypothetical protein n=1 Tax=Salmonella enterica TaxID=28901 RepID=UPI003F4C5C35